MGTVIVSELFQSQEPSSATHPRAFTAPPTANPGVVGTPPSWEPPLLPHTLPPLGILHSSKKLKTDYFHLQNGVVSTCPLRVPSGASCKLPHGARVGTGLEGTGWGWHPGWLRDGQKAAVHPPSPPPRIWVPPAASRRLLYRRALAMIRNLDM